MARAATLVLLLVLACTGAQATFLGRRFGPGNLCAAGVAPGAVPASTFKAFPANGVIELSWAAVPCATTYAVEVVRTDVSNVNKLSFVVAGTSAVAQNVANASPYRVSIKACATAALCSPATVVDSVIPSGSVKPTITNTVDGTKVAPVLPAAGAAAAGTAAAPATSTGWRVVPSDLDAQRYRIRHSRPVPTAL